MSSRRRQRRKQLGDTAGVGLIAATVLLAVGAVWLYGEVSARTPALDRDTLCPKDGPRSVTVILIDRTDPLTLIQRTAAKKYLDEAKEHIPRFGALEVCTIGPTGEDLLRPELRVCNPGRGSDIDPAIGNPRRAERQWRERFSEKVDQVLEPLLDAGERENSPIFESIQAAALQALNGERLRDKPKRLIILSDMLQHTPGLSHYHGVPRYGDFRATDYARTIRTDLTGVEVEILYLRRVSRRGAQGKAHVEFWQTYFADMGGLLTRVRAVEG